MALLDPLTPLPVPPPYLEGDGDIAPEHEPGSGLTFDFDEAIAPQSYFGPAGTVASLALGLPGLGLAGSFADASIQANSAKNAVDVTRGFAPDLDVGSATMNGASFGLFGSSIEDQLADIFGGLAPPGLPANVSIDDVSFGGDSDYGGDYGGGGTDVDSSGIGNTDGSDPGVWHSGGYVTDGDMMPGEELYGQTLLEGEGVLTREAVSALGGPTSVRNLNALAGLASAGPVGMLQFKPKGLLG